MSIFSCCFRARSVGSPNCQQNPGPCTPDNKGPRFLYDENKDVIGIDNSGSKYAPNRPIKASTRSYEEQLELAIAEEERARRNRRVVSHLELQSACK